MAENIILDIIVFQSMSEILKSVVPHAAPVPVRSADHTHVLCWGRGSPVVHPCVENSMKASVRDNISRSLQAYVEVSVVSYFVDVKSVISEVHG